jgi:hypothetical protein
MLLGQYSQHLIFFVTYEWVQYAREFVAGKPFQPQVITHSSLLSQFLSYKK